MTTFKWTDPDAIAHELSARGHRWADADAAYRALDDATKSVLAQAFIDARGGTMAEKEAQARASDLYAGHLDALGIARKAANIARVDYDVFKSWIELKRTQSATARAEMQLGGIVT